MRFTSSTITPGMTDSTMRSRSSGWAKVAEIDNLKALRGVPIGTDIIRKLLISLDIPEKVGRFFRNF